MSSLTLKSVVWYRQRYTKRFYVQPDDRWTLHGYLNQISDTMFENDISLGYSQALDIAVRVWAFRTVVREQSQDRRYPPSGADVPVRGMERQLPGD